MRADDLLRVTWNCVHFMHDFSVTLDDFKGIDGVRPISLDAKTIETKLRLFEALAYAMDFPEYSGKNWDAVFDSLTDLSWLDARAHVLFVVDARHLWTINFSLAGELVEVWQSAAQFWSRQDVPFHIVFVDGKP